MSAADDLARAQEKLEAAGKLAAALLTDAKLYSEFELRVHDLISEQALALNSVRFAQRALSTDPERIRLIRYHTWDDGYQACRDGKQRHNPYREP